MWRPADSLSVRRRLPGALAPALPLGSRGSFARVGWLDTTSCAPCEAAHVLPDDLRCPDLCFASPTRVIFYNLAARLKWWPRSTSGESLPSGAAGAACARVGARAGVAYDTPACAQMTRARTAGSHQARRWTARPNSVGPPCRRRSADVRAISTRRRGPQSPGYIRSGDGRSRCLLAALPRSPCRVDPFASTSRLRSHQPVSRTCSTSSSPKRWSRARLPECLVPPRRRGPRVRPAGRHARKRGATPEEDPALAADWSADPKERAEHVMLIDLRPHRRGPRVGGRYGAHRDVMRSSFYSP